MGRLLEIEVVLGLSLRKFFEFAFSFLSLRLSMSTMILQPSLAISWFFTRRNPVDVFVSWIAVIFLGKTIAVGEIYVPEFCWVTYIFSLVNIDESHGVYFSFNVRNGGCCSGALERAVKAA